MYTSEQLGNEWAPTILDTAQKLEIIECGQKEMDDFKSFWIGGSTKEPGTAEDTIDYSKYIADESGNGHFELFGLSLMFITFCFKVVLLGGL